MAPDEFMEDIGTLDSGDSSIAKAIDSAGSIVGTATTDGFTDSHGFIWTDALGMQDLNGLINPSDPLFEDIESGAIVIDDASAINRHGQIAATLIDEEGARRAIVLNPTIPFPTTEVRVEVEAGEDIITAHVSDPNFSEALELIVGASSVPIGKVEANAEAEQGPFSGGPVVRGRSLKGRFLDITTDKAKTYSRAVSNFTVFSDDPMDPIGTPVPLGLGLTFHGELDVAGRNQSTLIHLIALLHHDETTVVLFNGVATLTRGADEAATDLVLGGNCSISLECKDFSDAGFAGFLLKTAAFIDDGEPEPIGYEGFFLRNFDDVLMVEVGDVIALELILATQARGGIAGLALTDSFNTAGSLPISSDPDVRFELV